MRSILLLLALAATSFADQEIAPLITGAVWRYDHSTQLNLEVRFYPDGRAESKNWKGVWRQVGPQTIEVTDQKREKSTFTFNERFTGYTSKHFDGEQIIGKRVGEVPSGLRRVLPKSAQVAKP